MTEQDIVERLRNGKPEVYAAIPELRGWADWYVSCACGNVPDEAAAAYLLIEEFGRIDVALTEERSSYIMAHGVFQTEALRSKNEIDKLTAENASLRQQLADARETARREALEEAAKWHDAQVIEYTDQIAVNDAYLARGGKLSSESRANEYCDDQRSTHRRSAKAIRALSHPDREGERPSETETAARIVETHAQYYTGHNEDVAKALRDAAGAIRAQARPRREGERV